MTETARREILEAVAAGRLSPTDAADRLSALDKDDAGSGLPPVDRTETADAQTEETVTTRVAVTDEPPGPQRKLVRIKVEGTFRAIEIVGDDDVLEAVADGDHRSRREGDMLVIDGEAQTDEEGGDHDIGDWFQTAGRRHVRRIRVGGRGAAAGVYRPRPLRVRMNPDLALDARVEAGPLVIKRVRGPVTARVAAGPLTITGFESPIDLKVSAGKVTATGRVDRGESHIDCDAGKVRLHLDKGSHARVRAQATLGKVGLGEHQTEFKRVKKELRDLGELANLHDLGDRLSELLSGAFSDTHEVTVGRGTGSIDIQVSMGAADISFDDDIR
ncbi:MAG TPA: hypothetical protein VNB24_09360 [Acidimicrobiales bacterium]|nr:hypothetical protein [Acidimicrobiales bacterium]